MSSSVHVQNWLRPTQTACGVSVGGRKLTEEIKEVRCDGCVLKIYANGAAPGLGRGEDRGLVSARDEDAVDARRGGEHVWTSR